MDESHIESDIPQSEPIEYKKTIYWKSVIIILLTISAIYALHVRFYSDQSKNLPASIKTTVPSSTQKNTQKTEQISKFIIRKKDTNTNLLTINALNLPSITTWKNFLIYSDQASNSQNHTIYAYDFSTNSTSIIFNKTGTDSNSFTYLEDFEVIDDTFYFILSQSFNTKQLYYVQLPATQAPKQLLSDEAISLERIRDSYFLVSEFGDGCGGFSTYKFFDPITRTVGQPIRSNIGCSFGNLILGLNTNGKFYASKHEAIDNPRPHELNFLSGFYKNLILIDPTNPAKTEVLISDSEMPKFITNIYYFEKSDKLGLIMNGNRFVLYDPNMKKLGDENLVPISNESISSVKEIAHNSFCILQSGRGNTYYVSLYEDSLTFGGGYMDKSTANIKCKDFVNEQQNINKNLYDLIKNLKLPEGFEIVVE